MGEGDGTPGAGAGAPKPEAPKLPDGTPAPIKNFVECKAAGIRFRPGKIPFIKGNPSVTFEEGETPGSVTIKAGWGAVSLGVTATVTDGKLSIDSSKVPDLSDFIDGAPKPQDFTDFADKLNEWLKANGRKLAPLELKDGQLSIRKQAVAAPAKAAVPAPAPAPAPKPKEEVPKPGIKTAPGLGMRAATGLGTFVVGMTVGALAAPDGDQAVFRQPNEPVPVIAAQQTDQMPVEEQVALVFPPGNVPGEITISGAQGSFTTPVTFRQQGDRLIMELPGSGLPPFKGPIDQEANFEVRNSQGSFTGTAEGDRVSGDHLFEGRGAFTFEGTIDKPVVEETVTAAPPDMVLRAGRIGEGLQLAPASTGDQDGVNVPGAVGGLLLVGVGTGLVVADARRGAGKKSCDDQRAALERAIAAYQAFLERYTTAQERWYEASQKAEEAMGRLDGALPPGYTAGLSQMGTVTVEHEGGFFDTMAEMMAPRPDKEWQDIRDEAQSQFNLAHQYEEDILRLEAEITVALQEVLDYEALLARCEGRAPRTDPVSPPPKAYLQPGEPGPVEEVM